MTLKLTSAAFDHSCEIPAEYACEGGDISPQLVAPGAGSLPEGAKQLPPGALQGLNDWKRTGYGGPCPPIGRHRYFFKLYALDAVLPNLGQISKAKLEASMKPHVITHAELIGTYQKRR